MRDKYRNLKIYNKQKKMNNIVKYLNNKLE